MKRDMTRSVMALAILVIVYTLLVLVIPFTNVVQTKIGFVLTIIAFAVGILAVYIAFIKNPDAKSRFYGFPIAKLGGMYVLAQVILSIIFMVVGSWIPWWISVMVYVLLLAGAALGLISAEAVIAEIHQQDEKLKKDVSLMRSLQSKVNQMAAQCDNPDATAAVKQFAEDLRYSDPVSSEQIAEAEADLSAAVDELQAAIVDGDSQTVKQLCRKASALLVERNRLCKLNKSNISRNIERTPQKNEQEGCSNQGKLLWIAYGFLTVIVALFFVLISVLVATDVKSETQHMESIAAEIQKAFDDGEYTKARELADTLTYDGKYDNMELEQQWSEYQAKWIDQIRETARLEAIAHEIQKAIDDDNYTKAKEQVDTLVYAGEYDNEDQEKRWEEHQSRWSDQIQETERLEAIVTEIQKAFDDGDYSKALDLVDTLEYDSKYDSEELEVRWEKQRSQWLEKVTKKIEEVEEAKKATEATEPTSEVL